MKILLTLALTFFSTAVFALDAYNFTCPSGANTIQSIPGIKKAPVSPVVGLQIKVITNQVPLFLIKGKVSDGTEKNMYATDWTSPSNISPDGLNLLNLLALFYPVNVANLSGIRAALPTDLMDGFAYLELKDTAGVVLKLGFQGTTPSACQ